MNNLIYNIDFEIVSLLFKILIFVELCANYPIKSKQNRIFRYMTLVSIITEIFDMVSAITSSYPKTVPVFINMFTNSGYFMWGLLLCFVFHYYIEIGVINKDGNHSRLLDANKIILCIFEILVVLNVPFGFFFNFSDNGSYTPGFLFYGLHVASCWFVFCASMALIRNRKIIEKSKLGSSILFVFIYFMAVIMQAFVFPDVLIIMPSVSCILIVTIFSLESPDYIKLQDTLHELTVIQEKLKESNEQNYKLAYTDLMTGIKNRTAYIIQLEQLEAMPNQSELIFMIADVNSLKHLNDVFGHMIGDDAIVKTAGLLKANFSEGCDCYRIGGDEFAVIGYNVKESDFAVYYQKLLIDVEEMSNQTSYPFSIASGYQVVGTDTIFDALKKADESMYTDKIRQKKNKAGL